MVEDSLAIARPYTEEENDCAGYREACWAESSVGEEAGVVGGAWEEGYVGGGYGLAVASPDARDGAVRATRAPPFDSEQSLPKSHFGLPAGGHPSGIRSK